MPGSKDEEDVIDLNCNEDGLRSAVRKGFSAGKTSFLDGAISDRGYNSLAGKMLRPLHLEVAAPMSAPKVCTWIQSQM